MGLFSVYFRVIIISNFLVSVVIYDRRDWIKLTTWDERVRVIVSSIRTFARNHSTKSSKILNVAPSVRVKMFCSFCSCWGWRGGRQWRRWWPISGGRWCRESRGSERPHPDRNPRLEVSKRKPTMFQKFLFLLKNFFFIQHRGHKPVFKCI